MEPEEEPNVAAAREVCEEVSNFTYLWKDEETVNLQTILKCVIKTWNVKES